MTNKFACWIWSTIYGRWLWPGDRVIKVLGWRTAMVENRQQRRWIQPCFWIFD